jgi:hypothetical protein
MNLSFLDIVRRSKVCCLFLIRGKSRSSVDLMGVLLLFKKLVFESINIHSLHGKVPTISW